MSILSKLSSSLHRRDEVPNQELAKQIADKKDTGAILELIDNLGNKSKDIQSDCIKVLYEIGEHNPALTAGYAKDFIELLDSKNNRLQWGAMTALSSIVSENPKPIYAALAKITAASDAGSVITKDHCVKILLKLCAIKQYAENAFILFNEQLLNSPANQFPTYAENAMPIINEKNRGVFLRTLASRVDDIETHTKRKRVEKVIAKVKILNKEKA